MGYVRFRACDGMIRDGEWTSQGIEAASHVYDPDDVLFLPPVIPTKIIGVSRNNFDLPKTNNFIQELPNKPRLFLKTPNTVSAHNDTVMIPSNKDIEFESELAIIIGKQCRNIDQEDSIKVIDGYTCANDITNRTDNDTYGVRFKSFDNACVVGPEVVPIDTVPEDANIELSVNDELRQSTDRTRFKFSVPEIIEEITTHMTLEPGDIVLTGTGPGIGNLNNNDEIAINIDGIKTLEHDVGENNAI